MPVQQFDNTPVFIEQMKIVQDANENAIIESPTLLPVKDNNNVISDNQEQTVIDSDVKTESISLSTLQKIYKKSSGRPKKTRIASQVCS